MWRLLVIPAALVWAGCETCGDAAEPLIDIEVTLGSAPAANQYIHAAMYNPADEYVTGIQVPASEAHDMKWTYVLGNCDGNPQMSGRFPIRGWLSTSSARDERPAPADIQATDVIDVTCTAEGGCVAMRAALLPLR